MKKILMYFLLEQGRRMDAKLKKKLLIGAGAFALVLMVGVGFTGYFVIKASAYAWNQIQGLPAVNALPTQLSPDALVNQATALPQTVTSANCQSAVLGLLNLNTWVNVPLAETFNKVQSACWMQKPELKVPAEGDWY